MVKPKCCPTCHQLLPPTVVLPRLRQRIYDFVARHPHGATVDDIVSYVYADDPDGGPENAAVCIRTQIYFINSKVLRPMGLQIKGKAGPQGLYKLVAYEGRT